MQPHAENPRAALAWLLFAAWLAVSLVGILVAYAGGLPLPHGTGRLPKPGFGAAVALWMLLGTPVALALARALYLGIPPGAIGRLLDRGSDRAWLAGSAVLAGVLGTLVAYGIGRDLPLIEDESLYQLQAQLLGSGRLYVDSAPEAFREFFHNNFLVNDGRRYAQYFVGWPLLLAPFVRLGVPGLANPTYLALTVPAVGLLARTVAGSRGARVAVLLFATAPLCVLAAGTRLSHVSEMFLVAWTAVLALSAREPGAPAWRSAAMGALFCEAFFVRPTTAVGLGGPFLLAWLGPALLRRDWRALAAFAVPVGLLAGAFLVVNQLQNGSPLLVAYQAYRRHAAATGFTYTTAKPDVVVANFRFDLWRVAGMPAEALYRLGYASFGWPIGLLLCAAAWRRRGTGVFFASAAGVIGVHCLLDSTGMDLFGPVHVMEAVLPLTVLLVAGLAALEEGRPSWAGRAAACVVAACVALGLAGYAPTRAQNMAHVAAAQADVYALTAGLTDAVVFVPDRKFTHKCQSHALRMRHNFRPESDPDLADPVVWVNDLGNGRDAKLMAAMFPDRTGFLLRWRAKQCRPELVLLGAP